MAGVCRFYKPGDPNSCKFGSGCKYTHDNNNNNRGGGNQNNNNRGNRNNNRNQHQNQNQDPQTNPWLQIQNRGPGANQLAAQSPFSERFDSNKPFAPTGRFNSAPPVPDNDLYHLDANTIIRDLTAEKPQWILSCYGPGKNAPEQIFGGNREQSFEEMRYKYYLAVHQGTAPEAVNEAIALWESAEAQNNVVLGDVHGAIRSVIARGEQRPNRIDYTSTSGLSRPSTTQAAASTSAVAFGKSSNLSTASTFGQPSAPNQTPSFGQPSNLGPPSVFGQPSVLKSTATFGQPSSLGTSSAFGQPSVPQQTSTFGQPSRLGAPSVFGQPSAPQQSSTFGQPSNLGAQPTFEQPSVPNQLTPFGQPSAPNQSTTFGQPSNLVRPPTFSEVPKNPNPFASSVAPTRPLQTNPFTGNLAPGPPLATSFGQNSSNSPANANPFNNNSQLPPVVPPRVSSAAATPQSGLSPTAAPAAAPTIGPVTAGRASPPPQRISVWTGRPVVYLKENEEDKEGSLPCFKREDGKLERIWFPNGPPSTVKAEELPSEAEYAKNKKTEARYKYTKEHGKFKNGKIPILPPKLEWCDWNF